MLNKLLGLLFFVSICCGLVSADQSDNLYNTLKSKYLTLRNTDLRIEKPEEWKNLAFEFRKFVSNNPKSSEAPSALLNASILLHVLYGSSNNEQDLNYSLEFLQQGFTNYAKHNLADDLLVKYADIQLYTRKDKQLAREYYSKVLEQYANSDMYAIANQRIEEIDRGIESHTEQQQEDDESKERTGKIIVLDPGHGGEDFGAVGVAKSLEKDIVLAVAFELEKLLKENSDWQVHLTRRDDSFVPLAARTKVANDVQADVFISLHANSSPGRKAQGLEVYYLDNSNDQASKLLAERENSSAGFNNQPGDLQLMLSDLIQNSKLAESIQFANLVNKSLIANLKAKWPDVKTLGVKKAPFYVLVGAHMPCILVELFFVDNIKDGSRLLRRDFRQAMAKGLHDGIFAYLNHNENR